MKILKLYFILLFTVIVSSCSNKEKNIDNIIDTSSITINERAYIIKNGYVNEDENSNFHFFFTNGELLNDACKYSDETIYVLSFIVNSESGSFNDINALYRKDFSINSNNRCNTFQNTEFIEVDVKINRNADGVLKVEFEGNDVYGQFLGDVRPTFHKSIDNL